MAWKPINSMRSFLVPQASGLHLIGAIETNAAQKQQSARATTNRTHLPPRVKNTPPGPQTPTSHRPLRPAATSTSTRNCAPAVSTTATNTSHTLRTSNSSQPAVAAHLLRDGMVAPLGRPRAQDGLAGRVPAETDQASVVETAGIKEQAKRQLKSTKEIVGAMSEFVRDNINETRNNRCETKTNQARIVKSFEEINALLMEFDRATDENKPDGKKPDGKKSDKKKQKEEKNKEDLFLSGGHEAARNCFQAIAKICSRVNLEDSKNNPLQTTFDQLGGLSEVLKRFHFTQSAAYRSEQWAETMANNLGKICPGLLLQRPGSEISQSTEFGAGVSTSIIPWILSFGPKAVCRAMILKTRKTDEDADSLHLTSRVMSVEAGVQAKLMNVPDFHNKNKAFLSISLIGKCTRERGNYKDYKTLAYQMMAENREDANYWKFVNRSGSEKSFGSRFVAVMQIPRELCWKIAAGKGYKNPGRMPNFNQEKLNKGSANQAEILSMSSQLFGNRMYTNRNEAKSIHSLFEHCYPSAKMQLDGLECDYADHSKLPDVPPNPLANITPKPTPGGLLSNNKFDSVERDTLSLELRGNFGVYLPGGTGNQFQLGADASMKVERVDSKLMFMKFLSPHRLIDPDYSCDSEGSHDL